MAGFGAFVAALAIGAADLSLRIHGSPPVEPVEVRTETPEEAVTVRIWDRRGSESYGGSGAIIGRDDRSALVLTCYHTHRGGGRSIEVRGHGWRGEGSIVAADPDRDLAFILTPADPRMPVARIAIREMTAGDRVVLSGFGGSSRGLMTRHGTATSRDSVPARTDHGDSGGPAFVDGKIVGVVVTNTAPGSAQGTTGIVPLRDVYRVAEAIRCSQRGAGIYQHAGAEALCGLFPAIGRALFANHDKRRGIYPFGPYRRGCAPGGDCPGPTPGPGIADGGPNDGAPWYAPGFGPGDRIEDDRPAPTPEQPAEPQVAIDLSGLVARPEFDQAVGDLGRRIDALPQRSDLEIVIGKIDALDRQATGSLQVLGGRLDALDARTSATGNTADPSIGAPARRHWVLVADWSAATWADLRARADAARTAGIAIASVDAARIDGVVAAPQLVAYVGGKPAAQVQGVREVAIELERLARGG